MMIVRALNAITISVAAAPPPVDPLGPVTQNPDEVRNAACRLVESRTVCDPPAPPQPSTSSGGGGGGFSFLGLFFWALLIAVLLALAYVAFRYFADHRSTARSKDDTFDDVDPDNDALLGTVIIDRTREPGGWREEAERHRAAGDYRDALRCRYRALVGDLARRGLLDEIPGRTTGEERRELRASAANALPFFRDAADLFDGAWYGRVAVGAADDDRFRELDRDVLANAPALPSRIPRSYAMDSHEMGRV